MQLEINGKGIEVAAEPGELLLWVLRDELGMIGTRYGCGAGICGACTVHVDGVATRACITPLGAVTGQANPHHRGAGHSGGRRRADAAPRAAGFHRRADAPVRLVHERPDHDRRRLSHRKPGAQRGRRGDGHGQQLLPLRLLYTHQERSAAGGASDGSTCRSRRWAHERVAAKPNATNTRTGAHSEPRPRHASQTPLAPDPARLSHRPGRSRRRRGAGHRLRPALRASAACRRVRRRRRAAGRLPRRSVGLVRGAARQPHPPLPQQSGDGPGCPYLPCPDRRRRAGHRLGGPGCGPGQHQPHGRRSRRHLRQQLGFQRFHAPAPGCRHLPRDAARRGGHPAWRPGCQPGDRRVAALPSRTIPARPSISIRWSARNRARGKRPKKKSPSRTGTTSPSSASRCPAGISKPS